MKKNTNTFKVLMSSLMVGLLVFCTVSCNQSSQNKTATTDDNTPVVPADFKGDMELDIRNSKPD